MSTSPTARARAPAPPRQPIDGHAPSYYAADCAPAPPRPALVGEHRCDVCVIGGGFTGLSAALDLAHRGFSVTVLEAERIGWGASGRNGGQIVPGYAGDFSKIVKALGRDDAQRVWNLGLESLDLLRDRVAEHGIDCHLVWGYLHAALNDRQMRGLADWAEATQRDYGGPAMRVVDRAGMAAVIETDRYVGGVLDPAGGHLQPLRYALGLAEAAERAGVRIHESSPVTELKTEGGCGAVTAQGSVRSEFAILAGNAYLGGLVPAIRPYVMPVGTYMIATEPLPDAVAARLLPTNAAVSDASFVLDYFRLSNDRRMLFGGGVSYSTLPPPNLAEAMRRRMLLVFPDLAEARVEYAWGGFVGITLPRFPHFGRIGDRVLFAQGFSGQGVALTGLAGRLLAETVAGQAERFDLMTRLPIPRFPGGRLMRMPLLVLVSLYARLRDLL